MSSPTVAPRVMPTQDSIKRVLSDLFNRPVVVTRNPPLIRQATEKFAVALYTKEGGATGVVGLADMALAAFAGAALTMIPAPMAERQADTGQLDDMVFENFKEIMNILASQFNAANTAHVKLGDVLRLPKDKLPAELEAQLRKPFARLDFIVQIPNYGKGRLTFLAV